VIAAARAATAATSSRPAFALAAAAAAARPIVAACSCSACPEVADVAVGDNASRAMEGGQRKLEGAEGRDHKISGVSCALGRNLEGSHQLLIADIKHGNNPEHQ